MPTSLILHLAPTPTQLRALQRKLGQCALAPPSVATTTRLYFDTARGYLRAADLALYVHRTQGHWEQVLACEPTELLSIAPAWRAVYAGGFDFAGVGDPELARRLGRTKRRNQLTHMFEARLRCASWRVAQGQGADAIEVTLERGRLIAGAGSAPFAQLHLTCAGEDHAPLFALAAELATTTTLLPTVESLAAQGWRLKEEAKRRRSVKAGAVNLDDCTSVIDAFHHIARDCLRHWLANRDGAIETPDDPEYVHQLRVAIRRMRAAIQIFRAALPAPFLEAAVPPLRQLMATLGRTRDLDVLIHEITGPVLTALPDEPRIRKLDERLHLRLTAARHEAGKALQRLDLSRQILEMCYQAERLPAGPLTDQTGAMSLRAFADQRLRKRMKAVSRCAALARADDPVSLHDLRIAIKRLRYGLEFFSSLLPKGVAAKVLKRLATLQEELGQLNDLASAGALLMASAGDEADLREAVTLVGGWHGARYAALLADIPKHLDTVAALRLPKLHGQSTRAARGADQSAHSPGVSVATLPETAVPHSGTDLPPTLD